MKDYEAVLSCAKFLDKQLKTLKTEMQKAEKDCQSFAMYDEHEYYDAQRDKLKTEFETTLKIKIQLEKYGKKLKHEALGD